MRKTVLGVLAVLLAVAVWALRDRGDDVGQVGPDGASPRGRGGEVSAAVSPKETAPAASVGGRSSRDPSYYLQARPLSENQFGGQIDVPPLQLPPPLRTERHPGPLLARSPEEAAWLDRKGFPTLEELESLDEVSEQALAEQAAQGDVTAMALLGEKQLRLNKKIEGFSNLREAALLGSIWAIYQLGDHAKRHGAWSVALAHYHLAALLGDWETPAFHMQTGFPTQVKSAELLFLPRDTAIMYAAIQYQRARRGLPPLAVDTRPHPFNRPSGFDPIGIYPRAREQRRR